MVHLVTPKMNKSKGLANNLLDRSLKSMRIIEVDDIDEFLLQEKFYLQNF